MEKSEASTQGAPEGGCRAFLDVQPVPAGLLATTITLATEAGVIESDCRVCLQGVGQKSDMSYSEVFQEGKSL